MRVNGRPVAAFAAKTRYQIGLAHVEKLQIGERDEVTVVMGDQVARTPLTRGVDAYVVRLADGTISVEPAPEPLRYA